MAIENWSERTLPLVLSRAVGIRIIIIDTLASREISVPIEEIYREKKERKNDATGTIDL